MSACARDDRNGLRICRDFPEERGEECHDKNVTREAWNVISEKF